ncbi:MAG: exosortase system-associated protein, TIGR04073 family [Lentisphaeria bacterium]|nr:exosortase system-associated protein, TIGR04073 family [Lentisphaeria bacterium]
MAVAIFATLSFVTSTQANEPDADLTRVEPRGFAVSMDHTPTRKLGRGISNILFGILEVPYTMVQVDREYGGAAGFTWGLIKGVKRFVIRVVVGVYEVFTFWGKQGTIIEPEFPFMPDERLEWRVQHPVLK